MNIAIYAYGREQQELRRMLEQHCERRLRRPMFRFYENYDSFIQGLPKDRCDLVIVARDGADGMEGASAARDLLPQVPLIWFSDDGGFGPQSYRVGCAYFAARPITAEQVDRALQYAETQTSVQTQKCNGGTL